MTVRPQEALELTAFHEAGHAVVGHRLGLGLLGADLESDGAGGLGHTQFAPSGRRDREFIEAVVTAYQAGFVAESRRAGRENWDGAGFDLREAAEDWLALDPDPEEGDAARLSRLRARAIDLLDSHWPEVREVAAALLAAGRLTGPQLVEIIGAR